MRYIVPVTCTYTTTIMLNHVSESHATQQRCPDTYIYSIGSYYKMHRFLRDYCTAAIFWSRVWGDPFVS